MADWWEMAKQVYNQRGYLVLGSWSTERIGNIVSEVRPTPDHKTPLALPQPFRIVSRTNRDDYNRQSEIAGITSIYDPPDGLNFYRMVTE
jgi:hypothetical protein